MCSKWGTVSHIEEQVRDDVRSRQVLQSAWPSPVCPHPPVLVCTEYTANMAWELQGPDLGGGTIRPCRETTLGGGCGTILRPSTLDSFWYSVTHSQLQHTNRPLVAPPYSFCSSNRPDSLLSLLSSDVSKIFVECQRFFLQIYCNLRSDLSGKIVIL